MTTETKPKYKTSSIILPIDDIRPSRTNREIKQNRLGKLRKSIKESGLKSPLLINENGLLIEGHHRLYLLKEMGYESVEVFVKEGLTEEDVPEYNSITVGSWTNVDFQIVRGNSWVSEYDSVGLSPTNVGSMLKITSTRLKSEKVDPSESPMYSHFNYFVEKVWTPIFNRLQEKRLKPNRTTPLSVWEVSFMEGLDLDRLANQVVAHWDKINSYSKQSDISKQISAAYNHCLRKKNPLMYVDMNGKLIK